MNGRAQQYITQNVIAAFNNNACDILSLSMYGTITVAPQSTFTLNTRHRQLSFSR